MATTVRDGGSAPAPRGQRISVDAYQQSPDCRRRGDPGGESQPGPGCRSVVTGSRRWRGRVRGRSWGRCGGVRLPANAEEEKITARYHEGILEVTVPLTAAKATGRTIPIATGD